MKKILAAMLGSSLLLACSKKVETAPEPELVNVRVANNVPAPIRPGDCVEANRRAAANPNLDVERVAEPVSMTPAPIDLKKAPKGVVDRNGWFNVKFHVLVDTLGRPNMSTFAVETATHTWLGTSVKGAVAKWRFSPAQLAGCKVARNYSLGISPRPKAAPAAKKPATTKKPPL